MHANALCQKLKEFTELQTNRVEQLEQRVDQYSLENDLFRNQRNKVQTVIESIHEAVIVTDEEDKIVMASKAAGQLFGFNHHSSCREFLAEVVNHSATEFVQLVKNSRKHETKAIKREINLAQNDENRIFNCIISCITAPTGDVTGTVAVLHDITREKELSQVKNDFVNHVSHELKTPLASITAYSEMLVDDEAGDEKTRKEFYNVIQSQAKRLSRLIEDMLNTSRIESGLMKINKEPLSVTLLIEEQLGMIKGYADEKNINLIRQSPIVLEQVEADKDMLSQVVVNLLSNAVKYTPAGGSITVTSEVDETIGAVRVKVIDTGVGIPADAVEHVFDKFYRVKSNNKMAKGTGLGLNLVKQIVENIHGGRVFVKSTVDQGSTFGFELPLLKTQVLQTA